FEQRAPLRAGQARCRERPSRAGTPRCESVPARARLDWNGLRAAAHRLWPPPLRPRPAPPWNPARLMDGGWALGDGVIGRWGSGRRWTVDGRPDPHRPSSIVKPSTACCLLLTVPRPARQDRPPAGAAAPPFPTGGWWSASDLGR